MTLPTTPSYEASRAAVATQIKAALDAWNTANGWRPVVEGENRDLTDLASTAAAKPVVEWVMNFKAGLQASLGRDPLVRQLGQIQFAVKTKLGAGASDGLKLLDFVVPYLELRTLGPVETYQVEMQSTYDKLDWHYQPLLINFRVDRISPSP